MSADRFAGYYDDRAARGARGPSRDYNLTPMELECLRYVSHGLTLPMVATARGVAYETVNSLLDCARARLGAKTTTQAVAVALRAHLID